MTSFRPPRLFASAIVVVTALTVSACAAPEAESDAGISVNGCTPQNTFIPTNIVETCGANQIDPLLAMLVRYDPETSAPDNEIASAIETSDQQTFTVTLEEGWEFTDGTPVTADSFVDAWNWGAYAPNAQINAPMFSAIQGFAELQPPADDPDAVPAASQMSGLEVIDDSTFVITLNTPNVEFPATLGFRAFAPLPESFFEDDGAAFGSHPIGAGPFMFESATPNESTVLVRNPGYRGDDPAQIERLTFRIYQDLEAAYVDVQAGNLDLLDRLPLSAFAGDFEADLSGRVVELDGGSIQSLSFPFYDPQFESLDLRLAISRAIDREAIAESVFSGTNAPATGWVVPGVEGFVPDACGEACVFDPEAASEHYAASGGYDGTLTIGYNSDGAHREWVEAACLSITETLALPCQGAAVPDFATFLSRTAEQEWTGMFRSGWNLRVPVMSNFLTIYGTGAVPNAGFWSDPEYDALLSAAPSQPTLDEALATYATAEQILAEQMPVIPLWFQRIIGGYSDRVDGVRLTPFGTFDMTAVTVAGA